MVKLYCAHCPVPALAIINSHRMGDSINTKQQKFTCEWENIVVKIGCHCPRCVNMCVNVSLPEIAVLNGHICFHLHSYISPSVTMQPAWLSLSLFSPFLPHFLLPSFTLTHTHIHTHIRTRTRTLASAQQQISKQKHIYTFDHLT